MAPSGRASIPEATVARLPLYHRCLLDPQAVTTELAAEVEAVLSEVEHLAASEPDRLVFRRKQD